MQIQSWKFLISYILIHEQLQNLWKYVSHSSTFLNRDPFIKLEMVSFYQASIIKWKYLPTNFLFVHCKLHNQWNACENLSWRGFTFLDMGSTFPIKLMPYKNFPFEGYWLQSTKVYWITFCLRVSFSDTSLVQDLLTKYNYSLKIACMIISNLFLCWNYIENCFLPQFHVFHHTHFFSF